MAKIYISYSRSDTDIVNIIKNDLEKHGNEIYIDYEILQPGQDWNLPLREALKKSDVFLVLITKNSEISQSVNNEIGSALAYIDASSNKKLFIPIILDKVNIPISIQNLQAIVGESNSLDIIIEKVKTTIDSFFGIENKKEIKKEEKINRINLQYWHMQLHPNSPKWGKEKELLEKFSLIGLGKTKSKHAYQDFKKMKSDDIVLIKNGSKPIALVKVIGSFESIDENKDETKHLDWFKHRRKIKVLEFASNKMDNFPQPRGTLSIAKDKNTETYQYIDKWFKNISSSEKNLSRIAIPREINIKHANPAFGVEAIAKILSSIIVNIPDKSGMMVGIFGKWGRGKTYLVNKIWEDITKEENLNYKRVNFSAWKYQDTKESWAYLYETMMNTYLLEDENDNPIRKFAKKYKKLWQLNLQKHKWFPVVSFCMLFIFSIYWNFYDGKLEFVKFMLSTFGIVISIKLFFFYLNQKTTAIGLFDKYFSKKSYADYLGLQAEVENELENLVKTWIPKTDNNEKIILFVDDIDRCNIEQIISIVDGLRVILDNPEIHNRLLIITAIDEEILQKALAHKYDTIEDKDIKVMYQEYLEKVFIIGIKLNKLEDDEIEEFLINIIPEIEDIGINSTIETITEETNISNESQKSTSTKLENNSSFNKRNNEENISKEDFELTKEEKSYLVKSIRKLNDATPRKIRIFYYKYLILKQLFNNRLVEKNLRDKWHIGSDEKVIMDILIHISNHNKLSDFTHDSEDTNLIEALKYTTNMVSAL